MATTVTDTPSLLDKYPAGSILPQEGMDQPTWVVSRDVLADLARDLRDDKQTQFDLLLDLAGVDYPDREERFEAVYHLYSIPRNERLRLKVPVAEDDVTLPSLIPVWKAADWFEREAYDMFGLRFEGHPNLRRILTHDAFQGHPLRKDYDATRRWILTEDKIYRPKLDVPESTTDDMFERMTINIGPSHPAMHGTFRVVAELDGETIVASEVEIGYLHRCFEKMCETHTWQQVVPYTDRLNYCSSFINNVAYCRTVEEMLGIEAPPKAVWARTILSEFSRIMDHCVANGSTLVDAGALTNFWYLFQPREEIYGLLEACCGARLTVSYGRIGGLSQDLPPDFMERAYRLLEIIPPFIKDVETLIDKNTIFHKRAVGAAAISAEDAVNWGWTGPCLRACGVALRRAQGGAVRPLRHGRLGGAGLPRRRRLRPLPPAQRRDPPVAVDHPPAPRPRHAGRPPHRRRPPRGPAAQGGHLQPDGVHDLPLQADHGRHPGAAGRALRHGRGGQRRARLLLHLRRLVEAVPDQGAAAVLPDLFHLPAPDQRQ